jgi:hypothetical protein
LRPGVAKAGRLDCRDAALVIEKTLAHNLAHPLHQAGSTRRSPMSGLARAASLSHYQQWQ